MNRNASSVGIATLLHPVTLAAIAALVINDHALKRLAPGLLTGKLSDIAGLVLVPLLAAGTIELVTHRPLPRGWFIVLVVLVAAGFAAVKTLSPMGDLYSTGLGIAQYPFRSLLGATAPLPVYLTQDPTDLLALPALWIAWYYKSRQTTPVTAWAQIETDGGRPD